MNSFVDYAPAMREPSNLTDYAAAAPTDWLCKHLKRRPSALDEAPGALPLLLSISVPMISRKMTLVQDVQLSARGSRSIALYGAWIDLTIEMLSPVDENKLDIPLLSIDESLILSLTSMATVSAHIPSGDPQLSLWSIAHGPPSELPSLWCMLPGEVVGTILACLDPLTDWLTIANSGQGCRALLSQGVRFVDNISLTISESTNSSWLYHIVSIVGPRTTAVSLMHVGEASETIWTTLSGIRVPRLRILKLSEVPRGRIDTSVLSKVTSLTYNQSVPLESWSNLTTFLEACPSLTELRLIAGVPGKPAGRSNQSPPNASTEDVVDAVRVSRATLSAFSYNHQSSASIDTLFDALNSTQALRQLTLSSAGPLMQSVVKLDGIGWLENCRQLRQLHLYIARFNAGIFVEVLIPAIMKLPELYVLRIEGFDVSPDGWWKLAESLPNLKSISLWGTAPAGFFDKYPQLRSS
ncbi:hypothetical protein FOZ60_015350 [Perkinsus olseni]|uniref:Uncharacterized protein n=1 Tax=Perkinsus olseni TaxID=32597 RepID=A0A7J6P6M4_PEROL|nr:hypothetical protein FOZ60_015350 [Perkinsus olseni]